MSNILVLRLTGKSEGKADYVSVHQFDDIRKAYEFVINNTDLESKYWSVASIIEDGEEYEPTLEALL